MPFVTPNFNILCRIQQPDVANVAQVPTGPARLANQACQLTYGRRVNVMSTGGTTIPGVPIQAWNLLLPAGTDIRGPQDIVSFDVVEVPELSGQWWYVAAVGDIGKGFANEHRTACIFAIAGSWTPPYV